jgi:hypothetical protein
MKENPKKNSKKQRKNKENLLLAWRLMLPSFLPNTMLNCETPTHC